MSDAYGTRPGELAASLPKEFDGGIYFIGRIRTPWRRREECPKNPREAGDTISHVILDPCYAEGLAGLSDCSHVIVLYWMHAARRDLLVQVPRHLGLACGTFALRSPARPNPIALSVVRLLRIDGAALEVTGLDCLDGTACLDIKPYFASIDAVPEAVVGRQRQHGA